MQLYNRSRSNCNNTPNYDDTCYNNNLITSQKRIGHTILLFSFPTKIFRNIHFDFIAFNIGGENVGKIKKAKTLNI